MAATAASATTTPSTTAPPPSNEIPRRYVEQLQTTLETMRRRGISIYDGVFHLANRSSRLIEKTREHVEPLAYDVKDFVVGAVNNSQPLDEKNRELRNNLLELYLGISILSIGLSAGAVAGATVLGSLLINLFNPYFVFFALFALPGYTFLNFRKNKGVDETERRVLYFGLSLFIGAIIGHAFGPKLVSIVPSVHFLPSLVLALLIDNELGPKELFADRQRLMIATAGISSVLGYVFAYCITGLAFAPLLAILATNAMLWIHLQITLSLDKKSNISATDLQFGYIVAAFMVQAIISILFGNSEFGEPDAY